MQRLSKCQTLFCPIRVDIFFGDMGIQLPAGPLQYNQEFKIEIWPPSTLGQIQRRNTFRRWIPLRNLQHILIRNHTRLLPKHWRSDVQNNISADKTWRNKLFCKLRLFNAIIFKFFWRTSPRIPTTSTISCHWDCPCASEARAQTSGRWWDGNISISKQILRFRVLNSTFCIFASGLIDYFRISDAFKKL